MWDNIIITLIVVAGSLYGFRMWLDRLHPIKPQEILLPEEWERRFSKLQETVNDLTMGGKLRNREETL